MTAHLNHTIIPALDAAVSAIFHRDLLEAEELPSWGPFVNIGLADGVMLQFAVPPTDFPPHHYAYLVDDAHFDRALDRIRTSGAEHWADLRRTRPGEINHEHGGRGVYVLDPAGHFVELITRPYL